MKPKLIRVGDVVTYYAAHETAQEHAQICTGIVAEIGRSLLTGNKRFRIVDFACEISDLEAGIWRDRRDLVGDIITASE